MNFVFEGVFFVKFLLVWVMRFCRLRLVVKILGSGFFEWSCVSICRSVLLFFVCLMLCLKFCCSCCLVGESG